MGRSVFVWVDGWIGRGLVSAGDRVGLGSGGGRKRKREKVGGAVGALREKGL